jgi:hypothetical protein
MVEAFKGDVVCPNKQNDPLESFHEVCVCEGRKKGEIMCVCDGRNYV